MSSSDDNNTDSGSNFRENDHCIIGGFGLPGRLLNSRYSFRKKRIWTYRALVTTTVRTGRRTLEDHSMAGPAATVDTVPRRHHLSSTGRQQAITYGKKMLAASKPPGSFVLQDGL
jgi:hypothetical protein